MKNQKGLSLIELMVAITIGAMLLAGAVTLLVNNKRIYKTQDAMARMQENSRFALDRLISDIRIAGYKGCSHDYLSIYNHVDDGTGESSAGKGSTGIANYGGRTGLDDTDKIDNALFSTDIEGSEGGNAWLPSTRANIYTMYGDGITLRYFRGQDLTIVAPDMVDPDDPIYLNKPVGFTINEDDIVTISNCNGADIFKVSADPAFDSNSDGSINDADTEIVLTHAIKNSANENVNTSANLSQAYTSSADDNVTINSVVTRRYFVGDGDKGTSLFVAETDVLADAIEMVEGVDSMNIEYGVNTDADPALEGYYNATAVNALTITPTTVPATNPWDRVVSVRITLTFSAIDRDDSANPDARTMTTTVKLRNRS